MDDAQVKKMLSKESVKVMQEIPGGRARYAKHYNTKVAHPYETLEQQGKKTTPISFPKDLKSTSRQEFGAMLDHNGAKERRKPK